MMNPNRLLAIIKLRGYYMSNFLVAIQMPPSTWSKKIRGLSEFNRAEICSIIQTLTLNTSEVMDIFFNPRVS